MKDHDPCDIEAISIPIDQLSVPPATPSVDEESRLLLDRLVTTLINLRFPLCRHDAAAAQLHVLASLHADIDARITAVVTESRDQDYSWEQIATSLGTSPAIARRQARPISDLQ